MFIALIYVNILKVDLLNSVKYSNNYRSLKGLKSVLRYTEEFL